MTVINTNVKSLVAQAALASNSKSLATAMERLSTGKRINSAADDAAGLAISNRMTSQVRGLNMAIRNANDGISLMQTAEGAMDETSNILQRMRELAVQASNATYNASDRVSIQEEMDQLTAELDRIASTTKFNGQVILDGSYSGKRLQIGADAGISLDLDINSVASSVLGERADGPAVQAARASLTLNNVVSNASEYQGVDFSVTVNGVATQVSVPPVVATPVSAAAISTQYVGSNRAPAVSFVLSDDVVTPATVDLTASADRGFEISVGYGEYVSVDITAAVADYYGVNAAAVSNPDLDVRSKSDEVTREAFVSIVQSAIDATGAFTGDDAITVSIDRGMVVFSSASGADVILREGVNLADASANTFVDSFVSTATDNYGVVDLSADNTLTEFTVDINGLGTTTPTTINLRPYLDDASYVRTRSAVTAAEFTNVLNTALADAGFSGDNEVNFWIDTDGFVNVKVAGGDQTITIDDVDALSDSSGDTPAFLAEFFGAGVFDNLGTTIDATGHVTDINDISYEFQDSEWVMAVEVNGTGFVNIDMSSYIKAVATDLTQLTGQDMQAALQNALNDNFSGDLAVRVTLDGDGELGFEKVSGSGSISIQEADTDGGGDGTFVATFIDSSGDIDFNYYQDVDGGTFTGDVAYSATRDTAATSYFRTTFSTGSEVKADRVVAFTDEGTSAAGAITLSGDTIEVELGNTGVTTTIELLDGTYNTLEDLVAMVNDRIQASGAFQGTDAIRLAVYDGVDQDDLTTPVRLLALESVYGKKIDITAFAALFGAEEDSFIDDTTILRELGISPDVTDGSYATHGRIAGGIDTAATNGVVSIEVVDGANTISRQVSLATLDTNVSFETFMSDLVVAANAAFAADGLSFNGATSGSGATFALNQSGGKVMTLSGQIVDQAFGASVSAVGSDGDYRNLASMDDVVAEINEDLAGVAAATYDNSTGTLTFQALDGVVGATSTISLSGDRLTALNFGSSLEGIGTDGNAEAASIADISVGTYDDALAALTSIDNALSYVSKEMSKLGAIQNRLDHTVSNLTNIVTNTEASRSRIMDTDYGAESASLARSQIIQQAATAMLAQANQSAQSVLSLLQ